MVRVVVVYHSRFGHTRRQAEAVHRGAGSVPGTKAELWTVQQAIDDLDGLDSADAIVFGCPTYMGNMSAEMKRFMEAAVGKWFTQSWRNKIAGAFTNSSSFSGDKLNTLVGLMINALQHGMIYVGLGMLPAANRPDGMNSLQGPGPDAHNRVGSCIGPMAASFQVAPEEAPSPGDLETAEAYGRRIAEVARQMKVDREAS
ncbi:MAG: flavodoxin family protein [Thermogutta sp.]|nr:flavodoxin family protein [Thermogutta sp.]